VQSTTGPFAAASLLWDDIFLLGMAEQMVHEQTLSNLIVSVILRAALGFYVVYMSRWFYANPIGYFRKRMPDFPDTPWFRQMVRGLACFCIWGGCFIIATVIAVQILNLRGDTLAPALISVSALATWFLLPGRQPDQE
jgi:hypothetical protein